MIFTHIHNQWHALLLRLMTMHFHANIFYLLCLLKSKHKLTVFNITTYFLQYGINFPNLRFVICGTLSKIFHCTVTFVRVRHTHTIKGEKAAACKQVFWILHMISNEQNVLFKSHVLRMSFAITCQT